MAGPMPSPMSVGSGGLGVGSGGPIGGVASPALAPSPSSHHSMQQHSQQHPQQHPRLLKKKTQIILCQFQLIFNILDLSEWCKVHLRL